jgi:hypothetical protein
MYHFATGTVKLETKSFRLCHWVKHPVAKALISTKLRFHPEPMQFWPKKILNLRRGSHTRKYLNLNQMLYKFAGIFKILLQMQVFFLEFKFNQMLCKW